MVPIAYIDQRRHILCLNIYFFVDNTRDLIITEKYGLTMTEE